MKREIKWIIILVFALGIAFLCGVRFQKHRECERFFSGMVSCMDALDRMMPDPEQADLRLVASLFSRAGALYSVMSDEVLGSFEGTGVFGSIEELLTRGGTINGKDYFVSPQDGSSKEEIQLLTELKAVTREYVDSMSGVSWWYRFANQKEITEKFVRELDVLTGRFPESLAKRE